MAKVMVGMSGGVDSSVAAKVLLDSGYEVTGVTLKMFSSDDIVETETRTCCSLSDVEDARAVAYKLGFKHIVFNFRDNFSQYVIENFINSYITGKTPNPCIECNRHVKFGKMLQRAEELGFDYIATGHYALKEYNNETGRWYLRRPADRSKDQTYVLYSLTQHQLEKTLFPLADYEKTEVRKIAEEAGLINSRKPDSQDICFVPDGKYAEFIKKHTDKGTQEGDFTDTEGNIIGKHKGIIHYTIGQRKGLGIALGKPAFVVSKNAQTNTVVLGSNDDLFTSELIAEDVNLMSVSEIEGEMHVTAKPRYNCKDEPAVISMLPDGRIRVVFEKPQRAVTSGQAVVFYDGDIVVGGGTIV
ncbi:MAG: tRNA 2-thiouridine(34) synthase MnmA [Oscillospiraceae bacterium]|nr:tRNA 2-thiouridine(34) synthase MnmA [Oscillospiraceae bacterium]